MKKVEQYDVLISGAGYVGLAAAIAIKHLNPELSVLILGGASKAASSFPEKDGRAFALISSAMEMFKNLGCDAAILQEAQPVLHMLITDSLPQDIFRRVLLDFDSRLIGEKPLAYIASGHVLHGTLFSCIKRLGISLLPLSCLDFQAEPAFMIVSCSGGYTVKTRLLVAADGIDSRLRSIAGIKTLEFEYQQSAIACTLEHERPHEGRAQQHFLPSGPFATLPLKGNYSSIVWTEKKKAAKRLLAMEKNLFLKELELRFGHELGKIRLENAPGVWPIRSLVARDFVRHRFALIGDSAHVIHPLAGQGLNLGFKDVVALASTISNARRLGQDIGAVDVLEGYQRMRRPDSVSMMFAMDCLNRLFSNESMVLRGVRDFGLGIIDRSDWLKRYFIQQAISGIFGASRLSDF